MLFQDNPQRWQKHCWVIVPFTDDRWPELISFVEHFGHLSPA